MGNGFISKIKDWMTDEVEEDFMDDEIEEIEEEIEVSEDLSSGVGAIAQPKSNKIVNIHTAGQMKVVIVEPKKYEEVTTIADHLKQKKAVIVNLENLNDPGIRKSIFEFMNGAVYVLDGGIQKVSKGIFILAPNNVDIDANIINTKNIVPHILPPAMLLNTLGSVINNNDGPESGRTPKAKHAGIIIIPAVIAINVSSITTFKDSLVSL